MAYIVPNAEVYLLKDIKIPPNYTDTIFFATKAAQTSYFTNPAKRVATLSNMSYQRHSRGWLKVGLPVGTVSQANYMMFKNTAFENKWFYAFITDWEYLNNGNTLISYSIDDMQTWFLGDCTLGDCFVEREHAMIDTIGSNRIPEPVGSDRVVMNERWHCSDMENYSVIIQASQKNRSDVFEDEYFHQGQFNGLSIYVHDCNEETDAALIANHLKDMVGDGSYDEDATEQQQVVSVIQFPSRFTIDGDEPYSVVEPQTPWGGRTNVNGYTPRNKKLLTAPFKQLLLTNGIGASANLDYDEFITPQGVKIAPQFRVTGTFNGQGQIMCVPVNYMGVTDNYDYKIVISEFPQCGYTLDSYRAWLAGGGDVKQKVHVVQGVANGLMGALNLVNTIGNAYNKLWGSNYQARYDQSTAGKNLNKGALNAVNVGATNYANQNTSIIEAVDNTNAVSAGGGIISSIANTAVGAMETRYNAKVQSNIPVGMTAGNVMIGARVLNFRCYDVDINAIDAQIIDEFFDKFGYQTNRLKVPNISGRKAWNYVKTRECELVGNIPAATKASIIEIFNTGITFWKDGDKIGDYTQDNTL
jgi:hypothetical protein